MLDFWILADQLHVVVDRRIKRIWVIVSVIVVFIVVVIVLTVVVVIVLTVVIIFIIVVIWWKIRIVIIRIS